MHVVAGARDPPLQRLVHGPRPKAVIGPAQPARRRRARAARRGAAHAAVVLGHVVGHVIELLHAAAAAAAGPRRLPCRVPTAMGVPGAINPALVGVGRVEGLLEGRVEVGAVQVFAAEGAVCGRGAEVAAGLV